MIGENSSWTGGGLRKDATKEGNVKFTSATLGGRGGMAVGVCGNHPHPTPYQKKMFFLIQSTAGRIQVIKSANLATELSALSLGHAACL